MRVRFKRRIFHVAKLMEIIENNNFSAFALDSTREKSSTFEAGLILPYDV